MKTLNCVIDNMVTKFEIFTAVNIKVESFWVVMLCSVVVVYQCFRGPCCLHLQDRIEYRSSMDL
jgi:hypothetical protein